MIGTVANFWRRLRRDRCGSVAVLVAAGMVVFVGFAAVVVDIGYLFHVRRELQATADMAALAGAQDINCCATSQAVATAISYSAVAGNRNADPDLHVTMANGYPALRCLSSTGVACTGVDSANAIVVKQQTEVPLFFAKIFGLSSLQVSVTSTAGRAPQPADVMLVLDVTQSMGNPDPACSATRLDCAFIGFGKLLAGFAPPQDRVGLMIFPGLKSGFAAQEYACIPGRPDPASAIAQYGQHPSPDYRIVPLSDDYRNADGSLNANSNLVKAARAAPGCPGVRDPPGMAYLHDHPAFSWPGTYYADAIKQASDELVANGRPGVKKFIIVLGDGDADTYKNNACRMGINAARQAASILSRQAQGSAVISIAYGAPGAGSCQKDNGTITACQTMQQIASDPSLFYSDNSGSAQLCPSPQPASDLNAIFQNIALKLTLFRLLPDNTI